jgi:hypothetical protein
MAEILLFSRLSSGVALRVVIGAVLSLTASVAMAAPAAAGLGEALTGTLTTSLVGLFVVATLLESALATLFNWRVYREFFNGRAVKTLVMVAVGYAVVSLFDYDVVADIINAAGGNAALSPALSQLLSALVLAGGSSAVYQLFTALGLRPPIDFNPPQALPPERKAWVSVRVIRKWAVGEVEILWDVVATPSDALKEQPALASVIGPKDIWWIRLFRLFLADPLRFPAYGGRSVEVEDKVYRIIARCLVRDEPAGEVRSQETPIYVGRFANRAIVDFVKVI